MRAMGGWWWPVPAGAGYLCKINWRELKKSGRDGLGGKGTCKAGPTQKNGADAEKPPGKKNFARAPPARGPASIKAQAKNQPTIPYK